MRIVRRILVTAGLAFAGLAYVWIAAVRGVPAVRARKAAARARRRDVSTTDT